MKHLILIVVVLLCSKLYGQNITLPDGEYMDTTSAAVPGCKDYNFYYYSVGGKYPQSSSTTLKEVQVYLQQQSITFSDSGYITFRFKIDCEGKMMQRVQVLQTDENYKPYHFNKTVVNELFAFLQTLHHWRIVKTKTGDPVLYRAFITFKIKYGKVDNIIP